MTDAAAQRQNAETRFIEVLKEQRNRAQDECAVAVARSIAFQSECEVLRKRVVELEAKEK